MNDVESIRRVIADYCHLVDDGHLEQWAQLFTDDAVVAFGRQTSTGREEILAWIRGIAAHWEQPGRHFCTNSAIDVSGDTATAVTDWMRIEAGSPTIAAGRYVDEFRRDGGQWRISSRTLSILRPNKPAAG